jgi:hypothetical protein
MCASVCPTGAITFGKYEDIVPLRRTKPVKSHVFGNQKVETNVYLMLPIDAEEVEVGGCGVFEGRTIPERQGTPESWIDLQVEKSDKSNEF